MQSHSSSRSLNHSKSSIRNSSSTNNSKSSSSSSSSTETVPHEPLSDFIDWEEALGLTPESLDDDIKGTDEIKLSSRLYKVLATTCF